MFKKAFTMMELVIAMAVVAILVLVSIPIAKSKMDKVDKFSYYLAYAAVQDIAANIVAQTEYEYDAADLATSYVEDIWNNQELVAYNSNKFNRYLGATLTFKRVFADMHYLYNWANGLDCTWYEDLQNSFGCNEAISVRGSDYWNTQGTCQTTVMDYRAPIGAGCGVSEDGYCYGRSLGSSFSSTRRRCLCELMTNYDYSAKGIPPRACVWNDGVYSFTPNNPEPEVSASVECTANQYKDGTGACKSCSDIPTWEEYKTHVPPCAEPSTSLCEKYSMMYSATKGACVVPVSATNLCEKIKSDYNISTSSCATTASQMRSNTASGFKNVTPHIKLSNGLNIYIASDLVKIDLVADAVDVRDRVGYLLYVDVNGNKGKGILYQDVYPFYIMITGKVLPVYNPAGVGGANNVENLAGNIIYDDYSTGNRVVKASQTNVNYQTGVCATRYIQSANYCGAIPVDAHCADASADCRFIVNKPMKFFGR